MENIPRAFIAISSHRERVSRKRVIVGDKRMQLHRDLDDLTRSIESLRNNFQRLLSQLPDGLSKDVSAHLEQFNASLARFLKIKREYDQLDDDLGGEEYLLCEDEKRVYNRLATANGPFPPAFNKSMSSFNLSIPYCSDEGSVYDFSSAHSDSYEQLYGYGTSIGEMPLHKPMIPAVPIPLLPRPRQVPERLPIVPDSLAHLDSLSIILRAPERQASLCPRSYPEEMANWLPSAQLAGQTGEHQDGPLEGESVTATKPLVSYSKSDLEKFPPLFLSDRAEALLDYLVREFSSTRDRINRWLLHMIRSSSWEIRRFYLYFKKEAEMKGSHVQDEITWSYLVLEVWLNDIQPQSVTPHTEPAPVTVCRDDPSEIEVKMPEKLNKFGRDWHSSVPIPHVNLETHNAKYMEAYAAAVKQNEQYAGLSPQLGKPYAMDFWISILNHTVSRER